MHFQTLFAAVCVGYASVAQSARLSPRATGDEFTLFAYGKGIGGFPVLYMDGLAYIGDQSKVNSSLAVPLIFTDDNSVWTVNPNTTDSGVNSTFSDATFFVPSASASSHQVGFLTDNSTPTDTVTSGFGFYGHVALLVGSGGAWQTMFYAQATSTDGLWSLNWNVSGVADAVIPVTVKDSAPPGRPATGEL